MLGKRSDQRGLWEADRLYLDHVGKDTVYGLLASLRGEMFRDDDFAEIYFHVKEFQRRTIWLALVTIYTRSFECLKYARIV